MIHRVSKQNDLVISVNFNDEHMAEAKLVYFTDGAYKYEVVPYEEEGNKWAFLPSLMLEKMADGQLHSLLIYKYSSDHFFDGFQDIILSQNLNVYLVSE